MGDNLRKYSKIWWMLSLRAAKVSLNSRFGAVLFIVAKLVRFFLFLLFILVLETKVQTVSGYSLWQMIFFFATFNIVDVLGQLFLREVYRFRQYVISGDFDYFLLKPFSPLFRSLFGGGDVLDIPILLLSVLFLFIATMHIGNVTLGGVLLYLVLLGNAFLIALAFHILVLSLCIVTTEIDNALWVYRDLTQLGRFPVDIYHEPLRGILTFIVPIGIMMTFPAKALMGVLSAEVILFSCGVGTGLVLVALITWHYALRSYTSASS
ncbi:MAG: ABC-2 family transporter protein [Patescibacteria group bacterium]